MDRLVNKENGFLVFDRCGNCGSTGFQLRLLVLHDILGAACEGCWTALNSLINLADDNPSRAKAYWN